MRPISAKLLLVLTIVSFWVVVAYRLLIVGLQQQQAVA